MDDFYEMPEDVNLDEYITLDEFHKLLDLEFDKMIKEMNEECSEYPQK